MTLQDIAKQGIQEMHKLKKKVVNYFMQKIRQCSCNGRDVQNLEKLFKDKYKSRLK